MKLIRYTEEELKSFEELRKQGYSSSKIAELTGRSASGIRAALNSHLLKKKEAKNALTQFTPREMIKYLYELGYRIENNNLVFISKQQVNIKSILEEQ